jgi:hypothetical protein
MEPGRLGPNGLLSGIEAYLAAMPEHQCQSTLPCRRGSVDADDSKDEASRSVQRTKSSFQAERGALTDWMTADIAPRP